MDFDGLYLAMAKPSLRSIARHAMLGASTLAIGLGMAGLLSSAPAQAQTRTVINGLAGGGVILLDDDEILSSGGYKAVDGSSSVDMTTSGTIIQGDGSGNYTIEDTIFTNFATRGGAGSGGGAGLGGVLFINESVNVTLNNVDFSHNTVIGGRGGSERPVEVGMVSVPLLDVSMPVEAFKSQNIDPSIGGSSGAGYTVTTIDLAMANKSYRVGMMVLLPGSTTPVQITDITNNGRTLTFGSVTLSPSIISAPSLVRDNMGATKIKVSSVTGIKFGSTLTIDGSPTTYQVTGIDTVNNVVTIDGPLSATDAERIWNTTDYDGSAGDSDGPPIFSFINLDYADISQITAVDTTLNTITLPEANGFYKVGMVLSGGQFGSGTATITDISADGKTLTLSGPPPANLFNFTASLEQATTNSNILRINNSRLYAGMSVTGPGVPAGTTIVSVNPVTGVVTLSAPYSGKPDSLSFSGVSAVNSDTITMANAAMLVGVKPGMLVSGPGIDADVTVVSVSGTTLVLSSGAVVDAAAVSALEFTSPTAVGGAMNGIPQTVTGDPNPGRNGNHAPISNPLTGDGEGIDGKDGDDGGDGEEGAGGTGGRGGDGSGGLFWSPEQVKSIIDAGVDAGFLTAEAAAALANLLPDAAESNAVVLQAIKAYVDLGFEVAGLADWYIKYFIGDNAAGGDGGGGGWGGAGDEFFGGGAGGSGGRGGDAGNPVTGDGGNGGDGGWGGDGGFGAGGGSGGAGGTHGAGVSVADGLRGYGGSGGFGGGDGSTGDGVGGEGGSGFGGAIFVRDGGSLTITGNSTFDANRAQGGSSSNGGDAGKTAGTDLFMMKGSTVVLRPGKASDGVTDNVIRFNGSIGDDSLASFDHASNGSGEGAGLTIGAGLVIFNGKNTYTGQTHMEGGVLLAKEGQGLHQNSNLNFNGNGVAGSISDVNAPVFLSSGHFGRAVGELGTQVQWTGSGGFAALGGTLEVNLFNIDGPYADPFKLVWGATPGFFNLPDDGNITDIDNLPDPVAGSLVFGSTYADSVVIWRNGIDLNAAGGSRQIVVADNSSVATDFATITGAISGNGDLVIGDATNSSFWDGTLVLAGANTFDGDLYVRSGTVVLSATGSLADTTEITIDTGAGLVVGNEQTLTEDINNSGTLTVLEDLTAPNIYNDGLVIMMADIDLGTGTFDNNLSTSRLMVLGVTGDNEHELALGTLTGTGFIQLGDLSPPSYPDLPNILNPNAPKLVVNQSGTSQFDGVIEGAGALTLRGGGELTLTAANTYKGATIIDTATAMILAGANGSIEQSVSVKVDGLLDIAGSTRAQTVDYLPPNPASAELPDLTTTTGARINNLSGAGAIDLGDNTLIIANAASLFSGSIWDDGIGGSAGDLVIESGVQGLSGTNTYEGQTIVGKGATLALVNSGSIEQSSGVTVEGEFDISGTTSGASIRGLQGRVPADSVAGDGYVTLGSRTLTITDAADTSFAGVIWGTGGLVLDAVTAPEVNRQTLTGENVYTGSTVVGDGAEMFLAGDGSIARSVGVTVDGHLDIADITLDGTLLLGLSGGANGTIELGGKTLMVRNAGLVPAPISTNFAGVISGAGGHFWVDTGVQTLSGENTYTGNTQISAGASLLMVGDGDLAPSGSMNVLRDPVDGIGLFDISGASDGVSISGSLDGGGNVVLGANSFTITDRDNGVFSGTMGGTGRLIVAGGSATSPDPGDLLDDGNPATVTDWQTISFATLMNGLTVRDGGDVRVINSTINTGATGQPALAVHNGGSILTGATVANGTALTTTGALAQVTFDGGATGTRTATIVLGSGTAATPGYSPLLEVLRTDPQGADDIVNFIIQAGVVVSGDILDPSAPTTPGGGTTNVTQAANSSWSGIYNAGTFVLGAGATADFYDGSIIHGDLIAGSLSRVFGSTGNMPLVVEGDGYITEAFLIGNFHFGGDLNFSGYMSPGGSPGFVNVGNDLVVSQPSIQQVYDEFGAQGKLEITFGVTTPPVAGGPNHTGDYDQLNIGGNLSGVLPIQLANMVANGPRSTELGNIADMDVIRIGGALVNNGEVRQMNRLTQNGHEIRLVDRTETPLANVDVTGTNDSEVDFFGADPMIVYSPTAILQDETFALATLTGTTHQAVRESLGTYIERRGTAAGAERQATWARAGANYTQIIDTVSGTQTVGFSQIGGDVLQFGDVRMGLLGSYGSSFSDVVTETGTNLLTAALYSGGVHASWASGGMYIEAIGQYGWSDWTFTPTNASNLRIAGGTLTGAIEAGLGFGNDVAMVTPWGQFVYQSTAFGPLDSAFVDGVEFLNTDSLQARGGVRAAGNFGWIAPYADLSVSHDFADIKTVSVDNFDYTTGMGGMRVELGAGFQADVAHNITITTDLKGAYGIDSQQIVGYQGQAGLRGSW